MPRHPRLARLRALVAVLLAGLAVTAPRPSDAVDWRPYNSPLINFYVDGAGSGDYRDPVTCSDGRGGMWVAYLDVPDIGDSEVRLRRISNDGTLFASVSITSDAFNQSQVTIWPAAGGGCYVAWADDRNAATTSTDIYVQSVSALGAVQWTANGVQVTNAAGVQDTPILGGGTTVVVVWRDDRKGGADTDIYAARLNSSGTLLTSAGGSGLITNTADQTELSGIGVSGGVMFCWRDTRNGNWDVFAEFYTTSGFEDWGGFDGVLLCSNTGDQFSPRVATADGESGFVTWQDLRNGVDYDIYIQRVAPDGTVDFGSAGTAVSTASGNQYDPEMTVDGQGGVIIAWMDGRVTPQQPYAQRMSPAGFGLWTSNGVNAASAVLGTTSGLEILSDGLGGAYLTWSEARVGNSDLFGQRLSASGSVQWTTGGALIGGQTGYQLDANATLGQDNALLVAFEDARDGTGLVDVYAQRVDRFGFLGEASPALDAVSDVLGDQGGFVRVDWTPGYVEFDPYLQVASYYVLRQVPAALAARLERAGARVVREPAEPGAGDRVILARGEAATATYWEYVGQSPALQLANYSYVAPTTSDSVPGVPASTQWMLQARNSTGSRFWFSNVRIGHSVDNLAPAAPAPLAGSYAAGATRLTWNPNREADLAGYRLYRGSSESFVPSPANLVTAQPDTGYVDVGPAGFHYKLSAVDIHQNESPFALLTPAATTDVPETAALGLAMAAPSPNPAHATVSLGFTLAQAGPVTLAIHDAAGRLVRTLASGLYESGPHSAAWDLRDGAGARVRGGLYFGRLEAGGRTLTRRLVVVR